MWDAVMPVILIRVVGTLRFSMTALKMLKILYGLADELFKHIQFGEFGYALRPVGFV
jgi:hypothetical protein